MTIKLSSIILLFIVSSPALLSQEDLMKKADQAHLVEKNFEKSLSLYSKAAEKNPNDEMAQNGIGMALYRLGRFEEALESYNKGIEIHSGNLNLYSNRANTYLAMNKPSLALQDLNLVLKFNPIDFVAYTNRGMVKDDIKDYKGAILDYDKAIELGLEAADVYNNRGVSHWHNGDLDKAEKDYLKAIELDPNYPASYANYGALHLESFHQPAEAIKYYKKVVELGYADERIYFRLGFAYEAIGQYQVSELNYTKAIAINQNNALSYFNRGSVKAHLENYVGALQDYESSLQIDSLNIGVLTNRALMVYDVLGEYSKAIADVKRVIEITETTGASSPTGYNNLGYLQYKNNDIENALKNVEYAINLDPENSYAYRNLALILIAQGKDEEACLNAEKAISLGFISEYGNEIMAIKKDACK